MSDKKPDETRLDELVTRCLEAGEQEGLSAVERLLASEPELAESARRRLAELEKVGLLKQPSLRELPEYVGPYRILEEVGRGGMGSVHIAEQRTPVRRRVAIKVIKLGMDTREVLARFNAERQTLAMMDHSHIAKVYDAGATPDGRPYFVMEYVKGLPITKYCDRNSLSTEQRLELFVQMCDAVQHAHHKGVIHRDLKPSNVLVKDEQGKAVPKVIDFGISKATVPVDFEQTLFTQKGQFLGTPEYMSPEQAGSSLDVDTRTDVYSLGVMLYELLTGALPFESTQLRDGSWAELQRVLREEEPKSPSTRASTGAPGTASARKIDARELSRRLRGDLDWITLKALAKDRAMRYATPSELANDIRRHLAGEPVAAGPPSSLYRLRKLIKRHRVLVTAGAVVLLAIVLGVTTAIAGLLEARTHASRFNRLAVVVRLDAARRAERLLYPAWPENVPKFEAWFDEHVEPLRAMLPDLRETVQELEGKATPQRAALAGDADVFLRKTLQDAIADLNKFLDAADGTVARVRKRLEWARQVERVSLVESAKAWEEVREGVSGDPRFSGFDLRPQVGLVPIGRDPKSRLFEFSHSRSGRVARRDGAGRLRIRGNNGIVFVLVPGGKTWIGSQSDDADAPSYNPTGEPNEQPPHEVTLQPYFLSKYEMTQSQWARLTGGENPSLYAAGRRAGTPEMNWTMQRTNPVERVSWTECVEVLERHGLVLPTEVQWEHACRAGTRTTFGVGRDPSSMRGHANIYDVTGATLSRHQRAAAVSWDDGNAVHAPVGSYSANAFGMHDMLGNVLEWCRDTISPYDLEVRVGDGLRERGGIDDRVARGGSFEADVQHVNCSLREHYPAASRHHTRGLRPARAIRP